MTPAILAFVSALSFLGLAVWVYGPVVLASPWAVLTFWGLIGFGLVVTLAGRPAPAWWIRIRERIGAR